MVNSATIYALAWGGLVYMYFMSMFGGFCFFLVTNRSWFDFIGDKYMNDETFFYWELILLSRKLLTMMAFMFFADNTQKAWFVGCSVVILLLLVHAAAQPFEDSKIDWCEFLSLVAMLFSSVHVCACTCMYMYVLYICQCLALCSSRYSTIQQTHSRQMRPRRCRIHVRALQRLSSTTLLSPMTQEMRSSHPQWKARRARRARRASKSERKTMNPDIDMFVVGEALNERFGKECACVCLKQKYMYRYCVHGVL